MCAGCNKPVSDDAAYNGLRQSAKEYAIANNQSAAITITNGITHIQTAAAAIANGDNIIEVVSRY